MNVRRILILSGRGLGVYVPYAARLEHIAQYALDEAGLAAFCADLREPAPPVVSLLVDLAEEDFRLEILARTRGRDRAALYERHSQRLFRGAVYRHAHPLGRAPGERRRDAVLFSALIHAEALDLAVGTLQSCSVPLAGIHSLPLLSERLVAVAGWKQPELLLVTENGSGSLRQSFFRDGKLQFSRLSSIPQQRDAGSYIAFVREQVARTKRYLANLRLLDREAALEIALPAAGSRLEELAGLAGSDGLDRYTPHDAALLAGRLGYRGAWEDAHCDRLFAWLLARSRVINHYAQPAQRRHHYTRRAALALQAIGSLGLTAALLWSGLQATDGAVLQRSLRDLALLAQQAEQRYQTELERAPQASAAAEEVQAAVQVAARLQANAQRAAALLVEVSRALAARPELRLETLDWFTSQRPDADRAPLEENETADAIESPEGGAGGYQIVLLHGRVDPFTGDYRAAHRSIDALLAALRARSGVVRADALQLPISADPAAQVTGAVGTGKESAAPFELRVVREQERHGP